MNVTGLCPNSLISTFMLSTTRLHDVLYVRCYRLIRSFTEDLGLKREHRGRKKSNLI